jgi:hypothetical protein
MSAPGSSGAGGGSAPQQGVSSTRNLIGLVVLIAVLVVGGIEIYAKYSYNSAVTALGKRLEDETKETMTVEEVESLLGKSPDGPASDVQDGAWNFTKKSYSWNGLLKSYTLTAFYTNAKDARLHHYETEGAKLKREQPSQLTPTPGTAPPPSPPRKGEGRKGARPDAKKAGPPEEPKAPAPDDKKPAAAEEKKAAAPAPKYTDAPETKKPSAPEP